jgi:hypothetical protein
MMVLGLAAIAVVVLPGAPAGLAWATTPDARTWSQADSEVAAVQAAIQQAHQDQAQALASGDPSVMSGTATAAYLRQVVQVVQFLMSYGVTRIDLTQLSWGPISVDGSTATAVATETWHATFNDGTSADSVATNVYTLVQQGGAWLIEADRRVAGPAATAPSPAPAPDPQTSQYTSDNWSGYVAVGDGGSYTSVSGTWTVTQPVTTGAGGAGSTWVGIGGVSGTDLIQAGTMATVALGRNRFAAWIETLPQVAQPVQLAVSPGDSVTVSIDEQGAGSGNWRIAISNNTTGQRYQTSTTYTSSESSAEWIQEAPTGATGVLPLDNFQSVEFSNATTLVNSQKLNLTQASAQALTMVNANNNALAEPSPVGPDGAGFTVTRTSAPATWSTGGPGERPENSQRPAPTSPS